MVSAYTNELGIEQQANGENSGTWGNKQNNNHTLFEEAIAGYDTTIDLSSADATLTMTNGASSTARHAILHIEGVLTANRTVTVPSEAKHWIVHNATSEAFTVTIKTAAGSGYVLLQGARGLLYSDGVDVYAAVELAADSSPVLGGMLDVNGFALGDGTLEILKFIETASAVNELTIANAVTGNNPEISATGDDADIGISLTPKGAGGVTLNGNTIANRKRVALASAQTFGLTDSNTMQEFTGGATAAWTVPQNSSVAFEIDTEIEVWISGAGAFTLTAGVGVTINGVTAGSIIISQYNGGMLKKTATDTWLYLGQNQGVWA